MEKEVEKKEEAKAIEKAAESGALAQSALNDRFSFGGHSVNLNALKGKA